MRLALATALGLAAWPAAAQESAPLSAIDWLSRSVDGASSATVPLPADEPPVAADATAPGITVTPLDGTDAGTFGILPPEVTGLPPDLWSRSDTPTLAGLISAQETGSLPALQDLMVTLMLADAGPPADGRGRDLLLARVDKLLDMGALEPARELLASADLRDPEVFRRWFDVTLLTGTEHEACALLEEQPTLAPTLMARVFCLARNGDWNAAALTLNSGRALGDVAPAEELLLAQFLDPELEPEEAPQAEGRPSPLTFRLREAVGVVTPTNGLPLAFSHADLRDTVPWRVQIEAAERLARRGVLSENVLLGLYTARTPAASGGIWDRAAAIQTLDDALASGDAAAVAGALPVAWEAMRDVGIEVPFARLFAPALLAMDLPGPAGELALRVALLSPAFAEAARSQDPRSPEGALLRAVATGEGAGVTVADAPSAAVLAGLREAAPSSDVALALQEGRMGEGVLLAMGDVRRGIAGDHAALAAGLSGLRAAGLEGAARRAALQFLILGDRS